MKPPCFTDGRFSAFENGGLGSGRRMFGSCFDRSLLYRNGCRRCFALFFSVIRNKTELFLPWAPVRKIWAPAMLFFDVTTAGVQTFLLFTPSSNIRDVLQLCVFFVKRSNAFSRCRLGKMFCDWFRITFNSATCSCSAFCMKLLSNAIFAKRYSPYTLFCI